MAGSTMEPFCHLGSRQKCKQLGMKLSKLHWSCPAHDMLQTMVCFFRRLQCSSPPGERDHWQKILLRTNESCLMIQISYVESNVHGVALHPYGKDLLCKLPVCEKEDDPLVEELDEEAGRAGHRLHVASLRISRPVMVSITTRTSICQEARKI